MTITHPPRTTRHRPLAALAATLAALLLTAWAPAQAALATVRLAGTADAIDGYSPWSLSAGAHNYTLAFVFDTDVPDSQPDPTRGLYASALQSISVSFNGGLPVELDLIDSRIHIDVNRDSNDGPHQRIIFQGFFSVPGAANEGAGTFQLMLEDHHGPSDGGNWALLDDSLGGTIGIDLADFASGYSPGLLSLAPATADDAHSTIFLTLSSLSVTLQDLPPTQNPVPAPLTPALVALGLCALGLHKRAHRAPTAA